MTQSLNHNKTLAKYYLHLMLGVPLTFILMRTFSQCMYICHHISEMHYFKWSQWKVLSHTKNYASTQSVNFNENKVFMGHDAPLNAHRWNGQMPVKVTLKITHAPPPKQFCIETQKPTSLSLHRNFYRGK